jgi:hypothetical protein
MEATRGIFIHLVVPVAGVLAFLKICLDIRKKEIPDPPYFPIFALFFGYGGWLMQLLTLLYWYVSGMMILGLLFLLFAMPLVVIGCIVWVRPKRELSKYHAYTLKGSYGYLILSGFIGIVLFLIMGQR